MSKSAWNRRQKIARLMREITHFRAQAARRINPLTPQEKRARTLALRCLAERERDLGKIRAVEHL